MLSPKRYPLSVDEKPQVVPGARQEARQGVLHLGTFPGKEAERAVRVDSRQGGGVGGLLQAVSAEKSGGRLDVSKLVSLAGGSK